ncbi:MAG: sulfurtransferase TusA family protein [Thiogranum sp.]|nr:sulfurtransferase TusA family protein [Thiogranum sp.]
MKIPEREQHVMLHFDDELDTSGLICPMPVMRIKKALKGLSSGQVLHVIATDPASADDIPDLLDTTGDRLLESCGNSGSYHFYIKKR